jgi:hypothetical protein
VVTEDRDWDARVIAPAEVLVRYYGLPYDQAERVILNAGASRQRTVLECIKRACERVACPLPRG